ncbi:divergent polysaccharide deacetylase family protein [Sneathiella glossodoripedis]|uniref:divergent polysaccharide deacetylase family protein n=1 Tax=Sneathiella glossodoripedis TaxID=418853 RepID=UPI0004700085|nr:divergent polysaccharide deacetylase family protein [Sneathiella glossodoripedis]
MASSDKKAIDDLESQSRFDRIMNSPARLLTFCGALLVFSLMSGMMIGSFIKDRNRDQSLTSAPVQEIFIPGDVRSSAEKPQMQASVPDNTDERLRRPIDALEHDPSDYRNAPETPLVEEKTDPAPDTDRLASLPPAEIKRAFPEIREKTWQKYALSVTIKSGAPLISIVIDDVGLNSTRLNNLLALPKPLTLAFLPYADNLQQQSDLTRESGHEVMLHLPMEPTSSGTDPGPDALLNDLNISEIRSRTIRNLERFTGYVGVNNHMGSKFTAYDAGMSVVMDEIASRGLLFLDSRTTSDSVGFQMARSRGLPTGNRDVFIDNDINVQSILAQLEKAKALAQKNGVAIAIGHPYLETIEALSQWMPKAVEDGFQFVPVSAALTLQSARNLRAD